MLHEAWPIIAVAAGLAAYVVYALTVEVRRRWADRRWLRLNCWQQQAQRDGGKRGFDVSPLAKNADKNAF